MLHTKQVNALAFSPNGKTLASASDAKTIRLWDVNTEQSAFVIDFQPRAILTEHTDEVLALAFSPDGGILASGGGTDPIRLWDAHTGQQQVIFEESPE